VGKTASREVLKTVGEGVLNGMLPKAHLLLPEADVQLCNSVLPFLVSNKTQVVSDSSCL
jgi:hypothetical protein